METATLTGRRLVAEDLPFIIAVWNDERVTPMVGGARSEQQVRERIEQWTAH